MSAGRIASEKDRRSVGGDPPQSERRGGKGSFRSDLFYRIQVARISLPSLAPVKIPLLVASFLAQFSAASGKRVTDVSHDALRLLAELPLAR